MELVFRLPQGLATSCPRALRPGTITPALRKYREANEFFKLKDFAV